MSARAMNLDDPNGPNCYQRMTSSEALLSRALKRKVEKIVKSATIHWSNGSSSKTRDGTDVGRTPFSMDIIRHGARGSRMHRMR